jgi:hypothetical protein
MSHQKLISFITEMKSVYSAVRTGSLTLWHANFWRTRQYKLIYNLKIDTIEMLIHHSKKKKIFFQL